MSIREVVDRALEHYKQNRDLQSARREIDQAVMNNELELGFHDQALAELKAAIEALPEEEDDEMPNQLERILSKSLLPGAFDEHTEKNAAPSKSGACEVVAPSSSD